MSWYLIYFGNESSRKTRLWDYDMHTSKENALEAACECLRRGQVVRDIQFGGKTVMDEAAIRNHCLSQSK